MNDRRLKRIAGVINIGCAGIGVFLAIVIATLMGRYGFNPVDMLSSSKALNVAYSDKRLYTEVCWLTSHNSFAYPIPFESDVHAVSNLHLIPNQILTIEQQLLFGVRSFMIDLHYDDDNKNIVIAHEKIRLFEQSFFSFLEGIKKWLDAHDKDIITIHFESYIGDYEKLIKVIDSAGLKDYLFDLNDFGGKWPTLGEMRKPQSTGKLGKRLVIFSDKREDTRDSNGNRGHGIMHVSNYMETQYNLDSYKNCEMRKEGRAITAPLLLINHFHPITIVAGSYGINFNHEKKIPIAYPPITKLHNYDQIRDRVCMCFAQTGKLPNFIAFDFVGSSFGKELDIILDINNGVFPKICP